MKKVYFLGLLLGLFTLIPFSNSFAKGAGVTGASFLKIGMGVRPVGMGGAFCGVSDDVNAIYWNPAGLINLSGREFTAVHTEWFEGITHQFLGYGQKWGEKSAWGGSITYLSAKDTARSEWGEDLGSFTIRDAAYTLAYSQQLNKSMAGGVNLKYISQKLEEEKASGIGADLGLFYETPLKNLTCGLNIQNIGTEMKFVSEGDPLPFNIKFGSGYRLLDDILTLALDINLPGDNNLYINLGGEYWLQDMLALRLGYRSDLGDIKGGISIGIGYELDRYNVDYAFVSYGDLGDTSRISFSIMF